MSHQGGSLFDIHARDLLVGRYPRTAESKIQNLTIYKMLEKAGAEFTYPVDSLEYTHCIYWCEQFGTQIQELVTFPEMVDCMF